PWLDPTSLVVIVWSAAVVGAALTMRAQHDAVRAEEQRAESVRAAQDSVVARRLTEERVRIARDLHDSVAHGISAIALQTSAIDAALGDPVQARERLRVVRSTARQVLDETQQVLRLLRAGEGSTGEAELATIVADARAAGDVVEASVDPSLHGEDELVRISLAQILREALTNARRHGHGAVSVRLHVGDSVTELVVVNGLPARPQSTRSPGLGIRGMRERAEALHGDLLVQRTTSEFSLTVRIPRTAGAEDA
ncbi:MAG: histidine kinase, partial [Curtobacterium sp.]